MQSRLSALILAVFLALAANTLYADDINARLEKVFFNTFNEPDRFRDCGIFQLLEYSSDEISQISRITPRPESVTVETQKTDDAGVFKSIRVICNRVRYYNLTINRAVFEFPDCSIDVKMLEQGTLRFVSGSVINLKTEVSQDDILRVFNFFAAAKSLSSLKLSLGKDVVQLRGRARRGFFLVGFNLKGETVLQDSKTVNFNCRRLVLNGIPMPRNIINSMFAKINPVFDASKTWINLKIDRIRVKKGFVETIATIERRNNKNANTQKNISHQ